MENCSACFKHTYCCSDVGTCIKKTINIKQSSQVALTV